MNNKLHIKWLYAPKETQDGTRILVDRLLPHGRDQRDLDIDLWCQQVAPSSGLKRQLAQGELDWKNFARYYRDELYQQPDKTDELIHALQTGPVTLLTAEREPEQSPLPILKELLELWVKNGVPEKPFS
jgi:uncharacterized protein YeaO (DUF488 family)